MVKRVRNERIQCKVENEHRTSKGRLQQFDVIAVRSKDRKTIGRLEIEVEDNGRAYVSSVKVMKSYRGKGLGKLMYSMAISFHGELNTRFDEASTLAQRVWLSLIRSGDYEFDWQEGTYLCLWPKGKRRKRRK